MNADLFLRISPTVNTPGERKDSGVITAAFIFHTLTTSQELLRYKAIHVKKKRLFFS